MSVTIVIPAYNAEQYLERCIKSIEQQTILEKEVIVIDDGSTDKTMEILLRMKWQYNNIVILQQQHKGAGPARNFGIKNAREKYIAFCDADDYFLDETALKRMMDACDKNDFSICGSYRKDVGENRTVDSEMFRNLNIPSEEGIEYDFYDLQQDYHYQNYIYRKEFLIENDVFFPPYLRYQDPPFLLKAMSAAKKFWIVPVEFYCYNYGHQNIEIVKKNIKYVLMGIRDNMLLALENCYFRLYENIITERLNTEFYEMIINNSEEEVSKVLEQIEDINKNSHLYIKIKVIGDRKKYLELKKTWGKQKALEAVVDSEDIYFHRMDIFRSILHLNCKGKNVADVLLYMGIKEIYIYGWGDIGEILLHNLDERIKVKGIFDSKKSGSFIEKKGKWIDHLAIGEINDIPMDDIPIIVSPAALFREISFKLFQNGIKRKRILSLYIILYLYEKYSQDKITLKDSSHFLVTGAQFGNKGAQSMLFVAVNEIKKIYPNAIVWYLPVDFARNYSNDTEKYAFNFLTDGNRLKSTLFEMLPQTTAIVDVSGYALSSYWDNDWYMHILRMSDFYKIPLYIMPQSFGPFDFEESKQDELKRLLPGVRKIYVREKNAFEELKKRYSLQNVEMSSDLVLQNSSMDLSLIRSQRGETDEKHVQTVENIGIIPNIRNYEFGDREEMLGLYKKIIDYLLTKNKMIFLFPYAEDMIACLDIKAQFLKEERVKIIGDEMDCIQTQNLMGKFEFIISSRFHAIIHAYKMNIPAIAIGWERKYFDLLQMFGQEQFSFNIRENMNEKDVIHAIEKMENGMEQIKMQISEILPKIQKDNCFFALKELEEKD